MSPFSSQEMIGSYYFYLEICPSGKENFFSFFFLKISYIYIFLLTTLGLDKIEFLQSHENQEIYQKAFDLIEHYFGVEDDDSSLAPQVDETQQQFIFQQPEAPMEGFQL